MNDKQFIIGITGGSGVGKTTLIDMLYEKFKGKISTLSLDNYYKPKHLQVVDSNGIINFDLPSALYIDDLKTDLDKLWEYKSIQQKIYQFNHPGKTEEYRVIYPNQILLVEGLFVMHYPFVKSRLDYKVYLSVDKEKQLERRLKRDVEERNYSVEEVLYQWENHVLPAYENYVLPYKDEADIVITNDSHFDENLEELMSVIAQRMT
jgi:uridine kinase